ncbi:N-acetylmuramoyl-L-alanine amidase, partial [Clostridium sp. HCS.1]|uniref:N-acetylmuramoyl-L-alanine amidase n=1 Tax=Clostridium sp. HCS.1 TaxID=3238594 RepID=UPI003A0FE957
EILEKNDINLIYTRTDDISLGDNEKEDIRNRFQVSNTSKAEYFISFHINDYDTYGYEDIFGFEVWTDYNNFSSVILGRSIENSIDNLYYTEKRP